MKQCHCAIGLGGTPLYCDMDCGKTGLILGSVYPSSEPFIPANSLQDWDNTAIVIYAEPQRKGWICPKCDAVVSPDEKVCPNCSKPKPKKENADGERTHITETN